MIKKQESAVYGTADICRLFSCGVNDISAAIAAGLIPKPLPSVPTSNGRPGKRRWAKGVVNKKLGIETPTIGIAELVAAEVTRILTGRVAA